MDMKQISKSKILKAITYNSDGTFTSNLSGNRIGYIDSDGYEVINIYKTEYRAHRLALIVNGINNKTGVHGVSWAKELGRWRSRISTVQNRHLSLGCFNSFLDAVCARKSAEVKFGYHINHGRLSSLLTQE